MIKSRNAADHLPSRVSVRYLAFALGLLIACHPGRVVRRPHAEQTVGHPGTAVPVVKKSTVVAFWLAASDTLASGEGADLLDDFRSYTAQIAPALADQDIALVATTSDSIVVELEGGPRRIISLRGLDYPFGYVLVEPGYAETILTGVSTEDELLDEVGWYFGLDDSEDGDSPPGQVVGIPRFPTAG